MKTDEYKVINKDLFNILSTLIRISLDKLLEVMKDDPVHMTEKTWVKEGATAYRAQYIAQPLWQIIIHKLINRLSLMEEYKTFIEILMSDKTTAAHMNTLVGSVVSRARFEPSNIVYRLISNFVIDTESIKFNKAQFIDDYSKIEQSFYKDEIEYERITPLCGFTSNSSNIKLSEDLSIVQLTDTEIVELLELGMDIGESFGHSDFLFNIHNYAIKYKYRLPKIIGDHEIQMDSNSIPSEMRGVIEQKTLNALRMFKEGKIYTLGTSTTSDNLFSLGRTHQFGKPPQMFMRNKYNFLSQEIDGFKSFWNTYSGISVPDKHYLSVAIRRFCQSNERDSIEDRIIDLLISAEAIYLGTGGTAELSYRLAHRASMFLEEEPEKQLHTFNFLKKAYNVRSAIIHGRSPTLPKKVDGTKYSLDEYHSIVENYIRLSVKKAINLVVSMGEDKEIEWDPIIFPIAE